MSTQRVVEDNQLLDARAADHRRARRDASVRLSRLATVRGPCANQSHPLGCFRELRGRGRGAQFQVVNHTQACGCQSVTSEHAALIEASKHRVSLVYAFS